MMTSVHLMWATGHGPKQLQTHSMFPKQKLPHDKQNSQRGKKNPTSRWVVSSGKKKNPEMPLRRLLDGQKAPALQQALGLKGSLRPG